MDKHETINERYRLEEPLGKGGMGQVWRATDLRLERPVAIKILAPQLAEDPEFLVRFFSEAQAVARISHPSVVSVLDFGQYEDRPYLVMEYAAGGAIAAWVGQPVEYERALGVVRDAAHGVGAAHEVGIVHRDIKPGNILLTEEGRAKIADFGIALSAVSEKLTSTGQVIGSPHYISPEQATGRAAQPESDVYALGVVLYELITGRPLFDAGNATAIAIAHVESEPEPPGQIVELPEGVEALVLRSLSKEPSERYRSGSALAAAIEEFIGSDQRSAVATGVIAGASTQVADAIDTNEIAAVQPAPSGPGRRRVAMVLSGAVIAALLIAGGVFALGNREQPKAEDSIETRPNKRSRPSPSAEETVEEVVPETESPATSSPTDEETPEEEGRDNSGPGGGGNDSNEGSGGRNPPPTSEPEETPPEEEPTPQESPSV